ncbi:MAG: 1-acyl-sn-glycerol-3-phosphate acyltransferase [Reichenbachiella sp.]
MRIIKLVWYFWFWAYVRIALSIYFRRIKISGKENIPKGVPVIFGANHENALIDPLIMTTRFPLMIHYLVRADVFKNPIIRKFLNSLNLMPVYRIRDGVNSVKANEEIFKNCFRAFSKKEHLILFPEASHDEKRQKKIAKKGIARIALGAMHEPDAPEELFIVPVGMNYSRHQTFRSTVHIAFGEPIKIQKVEQTNENIENLRIEYNEAVAKCYVSFPRDKFDVLDKIFFHDLPSDLPIKVNEVNELGYRVAEKLSSADEKEILESASALEKEGLKFPFERKKNFVINFIKSILLAPLGLVGMIIHAPGLLLGAYIMKGIKDKVYKDTIFFGVGMVLMPVSWGLLGWWISTLEYNMLLKTGLIAFMPITLLAFSSMIQDWRFFSSNMRLVRNPVLKEKYEEFVKKVALVKA